MSKLTQLIDFVTGKVIFSVAPEAKSSIVGARLTYGSASTVTVGKASEDSVVTADDMSCSLDFNGVKTADIAVTGAGGLQTGSSEASDTWYGVYIIGDTRNVNATTVLLIPDETAFAESGYDVKRRIGWVRNNASSAFLKFNQTGNGADRKIFYDVVDTEVNELSAGASTTFVDVDLKSSMPPTSDLAYLTFVYDNDATINNFALRTNGSTVARANCLTRFQPGVIATGNAMGTIEIITDSGQVIEYAVQSASDFLALYVRGFIDSL